MATSSQIEVFVRGNEVIVRATCKVPDENGTLTDPTTITYTVRQQGTEMRTTYTNGAPEITNPSTGVWELAITPLAGRWTIHCQATGAVKAASEITFKIPESDALAP